MSCFLFHQERDTVDEAVQTEAEPRTIDIPIPRSSASHMSVKVASYVIKRLSFCFKERVWCVAK